MEKNNMKGMWTKKAAIALLLFCIIITAMAAMAGTARAAWEPVAQIGNVKYGTLAEAFNAAPTNASATSKTTVKLLSDTELSAMAMISSGRNVVLDLNGHNVTVASGIKKPFGVYSNAIFEITDTSSGANGTVYGGTGAGEGGIVMINENAHFKLSGGTLSGGSAGRGAAVFVYTNADFVMTGGVITDSVATNYGGAVYVGKTGTFTMTGGEIRNNRASTGGAIFTQSGDDASTASHLTIAGNAVITSNESTSSGAGVYVNTISEFIAGGRAVITGNIRTETSIGENNVYLTTGSVIKNSTTDPLKTGANIGVTMQTPTNNSGIFTSGMGAVSDASVSMLVSDNDSYVVKKQTDGTEVYLLAISGVARIGETGYSTLQEAINAATDGQTIKLISNISAQSSIVQVDTGKNITLDLNGKTITLNNTTVRAFNVTTRSIFTIDDTVGTGAVVASGKGIYYNGGIVYIDNATFILKNGTLRNAYTNPSMEKSGGAVRITNYGTFNMDGGTITGNQSHYGGAVSVGSGTTFNMSGGTIIGNTTTGYGGAVYVEPVARFTMSGGTITGNTATTSGGGVFVKDGAIFSVSKSAQITENTVGGTTANNVLLENHVTSPVTIDSALIGAHIGITLGNTANSDIAFTNKLNAMSDYGTRAFISDNVSYDVVKYSSNGEACLVASGVAKIGDTYYTTLSEAFSAATSGQTIYLLKDTTTGNIALNNKNITLNLGTSTVTLKSGGLRLFNIGWSATAGATSLTITGSGTINAANATLEGGVAYLKNYSTITLHSGTIIGSSGGSANGGAVFVNTGAMNVDGGRIIKSSVTDNGAAVYVHNADFTMTGGIIGGSDGNKNVAATGAGAAVYVINSGTFTMTGGEISYNESSSSGAVYFNGSSLTIGGNTKIINNKAAEDKGNLYLTSGKLINISSTTPLGTGARIGVHKVGGGQLTSGNTGNGHERFESDNDTYEIVKTNGEAYYNAITSVARIGDTRYSTLAAAFDAATNGDTITLIANANVTTRYILTNKNVTLDLNGKNITTGQYRFINISTDATLTIDDSVGTGTVYGVEGEVAYNGGVIYVDAGGTFNLVNGTITGGTITGNTRGGGVCVLTNGTFNMFGGVITGNSAPYGGGVYANGRFNMYGGEIYGNTGTTNGAGVYLTDGATFEIRDGQIYGNTATTNGGGVFIASGTNSTVNVYGNPVIAGNFAGSEAQNLYLAGTLPVHIIGALGDDASVGVSMATAGVFTSGYAVYGDENVHQSSKFFSDSTSYSITKTTTREIALTSSGVAEFNGVIYNTFDEALSAANTALRGTINVLKDFSISGTQYYSVNDGRNITLNMNGHTFDASATTKRAFNVYGTLTVTGGGTIVGANASFGCAFYIEGNGIVNIEDNTVIRGGTAAGDGGAVYIGSASSVFNLYSGSITGCSTAQAGGAILNCGIVNIYGGSIDNNTATENGGGIYVKSTGQLNMYGGTISSNTSSASGGGIYIDGSGRATIYNGTISGNKTTSSGGGISVAENGILTIENALISDNRSNGHGGGISTSGTVTINGGIIEYNVTKNSGGGIQMGTVGTLNLRGGIIRNNTADTTVNSKHGGGINVPSNTTNAINVSGHPVVTNNFLGSGKAENIYLSSSRTIGIDGVLEDGASMGISRGNSGAFTVGYSTYNPEVYPTAFFTSDITSRRIYKDSTGEANNSNQTGGAEYNGTVYSTVTTAVNAVSTTGTVTLLSDVTDSGRIDIPSGKTITLDLNGYTLAQSTNSTRTLQVVGTLIVVDSGGTGKIVGKGGVTYGSTIQTSSSGTLELRAGTIVGASTSSSGQGGAIYIGGESKVIMSGGTITGGQAVQGGAVAVGTSAGKFTMTGGIITGNNATSGGAVWVSSSGTFTMSGGLVTTNTAQDGAAVYDEGVMNISGTACIMNNNALSGKAGGAYVASTGTLNMSGGSITRNSASTGYGGVYLVGAMNVSDTPYIAGNYGENLCLVYNGTKISTTTDLGQGAAMFVYVENLGTNTPYTITSGGHAGDSASAFISDVDGYCTIKNSSNEIILTSGEAEYNGTPYATFTSALNDAKAAGTGTVKILKNITISETNIQTGHNITIDLNGKSITTDARRAFRVDTGSLTIRDSVGDGALIGKGGDVTTAGAVIYITNNATVTLESGTITKGYTTGNGGAVYVGNGTFRMLNGEITDNRAENGGAIASSTDGNIIIEGGKFTKNIASSNGGAIYSSGQLSIADTTIGGERSLLGNTAVNGGGVYVLGSASISDSEITNNTASFNCGGVYMDGTNLSMSGDVIVTDNLVISGLTETTSNVYLNDEKVVTISSDLGEAAEIGITMKTAGVFTTNYSTHHGDEAPTNYFTSDVEGYAVAKAVSGEAALFDGVAIYNGINYATFDEAITAAKTQNDGNTICILKSFDQTTGVSISGNYDISIDLNGKTITFTANVDAFTVGNGTELNIADNIGGGAIARGYGATGKGILIQSGGTVNLDNGAITGHVGNGAGVYISEGGTLSMTGGSIEQNNSGANGIGAGVLVLGTFDMSGGSITGNIATNYGGGVYNSGTFTMSDGLISSNTAGTSGTGNGGGVYNLGTFTMTGGEIINNTTYTGIGGGVHNGGTFEISGTPVVSNNAGNGGYISGNVYLPENKTISVTGALEDGANVYVTKYEGKAVFTTGFPTNNPSAYPNDFFKADTAGYVVIAANTGEATFTSDVGEAEFNGTIYSLFSTALTDAQAAGTGTITLLSDISITGSTYYSINSGKNITINLNNHTIDASGTTKRAFNVNGTLTVRGNGRILASRIGDFAGAIYCGGGTFNMYDCSIENGYVGGQGGAVWLDALSTFNMYSGEIKDSTSGSNNGGNVYVGGRFNMYSGTISGGSALRGGGVFVASSGTAIIYDGTITGNSSNTGGGIDTRGTLQVKKGTISNNDTLSKNGYGGGIFAGDNGTVEVQNANVVITGNTAKYGGGICVEDNSVGRIINATIIGNTAKYGGGVLTWGRLDVEGGTITENTATISGGGLFVDEKETTDATITGGTFTDNIAPTGKDGYIKANGKCDISGRPVFGDMYLPTGVVITVSGVFGENASMGITMQTLGAVTSGYSTYNGTDSPSAYFHSTNTNYGVITNNVGEAQIVDGVAAVGSNYYPTLFGAIEAIRGGSVSGQILVISDSAYIGTTAINIGTDESYDINFNGHDVEYKGTRAFWISGGELTLSGSGSLYHTGGQSPNGGTIYVDSGTFSLNGPTITGGNAQYSGGAVYVKTGTFNMTGGAITGNTAATGGAVFVYNGATFNMTGGTITGNTANNGGGVATATGTGTNAANHATVNVSGTAHIEDNTATTSGGGVYVADYATLQISSNGEISANTAVNGGGVYVTNLGQVEIGGGKITGNIATTNGGGMYINTTSELLMYSGEISENNAKLGGGLYTLGTVSMEGGSIRANRTTSGAASDSGAGIYIDGNTVSMLGTATVINNVSGGTGGGVSIANGGRLEMSENSTVTANTATSNGGGVYVPTGAALYMSDGTVTNNTVTALNTHGGGVYAVGTVTLTGAPVVSGNTSASYDGDNLFLVNENKASAINLTGGVIYVTLENVTGTITDGLNATAYSGVQMFRSDNSDYTVTISAGEATIVMGITVTFHDRSNFSVQNIIPGVPTDLTAASEMFTAPSGFGIYGWAETVSTETIAYTDEETVTISSNKDLYAVWSRDIEFKSGLNMSKTVTVNQKYYGGAARAITAPANTSANVALPASGVFWSLEGWTTGTEANAAVIVEANASVTPLAADTTYYAKFIRDVIWIFDGNGASGETDASGANQYYNSSGNISTCLINVGANGFVAPGDAGKKYTFVAWGDTSTSTSGQPASGDVSWTPAVAANPTKTVYAIWARDITFHSGAADSKRDTVTQYYRSGDTAITTPTITLPNATWTPVGWSAGTSATAAKAANASASFTPTELNYYAIFTRTLTINYDGNGATGSTGSTAGTQFYNSYGNIQTPGFTLASNGFTSPTGHSFRYWGETGNASTGTAAGGTYSGFAPSVGETTITKLLYAIWRAHTYNVVYHGTSFTSGSTPNSVHTYDVPGSLTANGFVKAYTITYNMNYPGGGTTTDTVNCSFDGWATSENGAVVYTNGQSVTNLTAADNGTYDLYAKWGSAASTALPSPTRENYTLLGWSISDTATVADTGKTGGTAYTPTGNITLYAVWSANNGITSANITPLTATVTYPTAAVLTVNVTKGNPNSTLTYQWQELVDAAWTNIAGANTASYSTSTTKDVGTYTYRCHVTSTLDTDVKYADTDSATVTVNKANGVITFGEPRLVANGKYVVGVSNGAVEVTTVTAGGDAALSAVSDHACAEAAISDGKLVITPVSDSGENYATVTIATGSTKNYNATSLSFILYVCDGPDIDVVYDTENATKDSITAEFVVTDPIYELRNIYDLPSFNEHSISSDLAMVSDVGTKTGDNTFEFTENGSVFVTARDSLGEEKTQEFQMRLIDRVAPSISVMSVGIDPATLKITTSITATDNVSPTSALLYCWDYNPDSPSNVWVSESVNGLEQGEIVTLAVKDELGNIATKRHKANLSSGATASADAMIDWSTLSISRDYAFGSAGYLDENKVQHGYTEYLVNGEDVTGIAVTVDIEPSASGVMSGYAKLSTGEKFPLFWEQENGLYASTSTESGTATFFINPRVLTKSVKNGSLTVYVFEYEDDTMVKKLNEDSVQIGVSIDLYAPAVNVTYNESSNKIYINAKDDMSGLKTLYYAANSSDGFVPYDGPFEKSDVMTTIYVKATDKLGNETTQSFNVSTIGKDKDNGFHGTTGVEDTLFGSERNFRTLLFNFYIFNGE